MPRQQPGHRDAMMDAYPLPATIYGLVLEPPALRPAAPATLRLTLRNRRTTSAPPLRVRFLVPPEVEVLDAAIVDVEPIAPGETREIATRVRLLPAARDGAEFALQAALSYDGRETGSNVVIATASAQPHLDGPRSVCTVSDGADGTVRLDVCVHNDGEGPADDVIVTIPPQPALALAHDVELPAGTIPAGEERRVACALALRDACDGRVRIDGITFTDARGRRTTLAREASIEIAGRLAEPQLELDADGATVRARVTLAVDGPVHVDDVAVRVHVPAGFRLAPATLVLDGTPASLRGRGRRVAHVRTAPAPPCVHVARLHAGAPSLLTFELHRTGTATGVVALDVRAGACERSVSAEIAAPPTYAPVLALLAAPPAIGPGEAAHARIALGVRGFAGSTVHLDVDGTPVTAIDGNAGAAMTLGPGETCDCVVAFTVAAGADTVVVRASSDAGEAELRVPVIRRGVELPVLAGDDDLVGHRDIEATLTVPARAGAGAAIDIALRLRVARTAGTITVRLPDIDAAAYLPNSTRVDGHLVVDGTRAALLDGLALRDVPAGTELEIAWRSIVAPGAAGSVRCNAEVVVDGVPVAVHGGELDVAPLDAFASRPDGLAYHVDAALAPDAEAVMPPSPATHDLLPALPLLAPETPMPPAFGVTTTWPPSWAEPAPAYEAVPPAGDRSGAPASRLVTRGHAGSDATALRLLDGDDGTLVAHVLALRVLLPDDIEPYEPRIATSLDALRDALGDVLDRLFVKRRIPAYDVAGSDCEDATTRRALEALVAALADAGGPDRARWMRHEATLAARPLGDAPALAVLADLADTGDDAAAAYGRALRYVLERFGDDAAGFDDALARDAGAELAAARAAYVATLRGAGERV